MDTILDQETIEVAHENQCVFVSHSDALVLPPVRLGIVGSAGSQRAYLSVREAQDLILKLDAAIKAAKATAVAA